MITSMKAAIGLGDSQLPSLSFVYTDMSVHLSIGKPFVSDLLQTVQKLLPAWRWFLEIRHVLPCWQSTEEEERRIPDTMWSTSKHTGLFHKPSRVGHFRRTCRISRYCFQLFQQTALCSDKLCMYWRQLPYRFSCCAFVASLVENESSCHETGGPMLSSLRAVQLRGLAAKTNTGNLLFLEGNLWLILSSVHSLLGGVCAFLLKRTEIVSFHVSIVRWYGMSHACTLTGTPAGENTMLGFHLQ